MFKPVKFCLLSMSLVAPFLIYSILADAAGNQLNSASNALVRQEWEPVRRAKYYEGQVRSTAGKETRVRTSSEWLLLNGETLVSLQAFDQRGRKLGAVKLHEPVAVLASTEPVVEEPEEPIPDIPEEPEDPTDPINRNPNIATSSAALDVMLAAGRETLAAEGGSSKYDGTSSIGGTHLDFRWQDHGSPWMVAGQLGAHYFETKVDNQSGTTNGQDGGDEEPLLRLHIRGTALYDLLHVDSPEKRRAAAIGMGLVHFRLPNLQISDAASGAAILENQSILGLDLAGLVVFPVGANDQLEGRLNFAPLYFSKGAKGQSTNVSALWRHDFDAQIHADLGIVMQTETITTTLDCGAIDGCSEESRATSKIFQGLLGVGLGF